MSRMSTNNWLPSSDGALLIHRLSGFQVAVCQVRSPDEVEGACEAVRTDGRHTDEDLADLREELTELVLERSTKPRNRGGSSDVD